ncbi:hypothetical protein PAXRUDRAFT_172604, partial [Paxillus rubicundulus Ve08.2h10]
EIQTLASEDNGSHFGTMEQLEYFSLEEMIETMQACALYWFSLLGMTLGNDKAHGSSLGNSTGRGNPCRSGVWVQRGMGMGTISSTHALHEG